MGDGGATGGPVEPRPRWSSIRLATADSAMKAMSRRRPPHSGQASTSMAKVPVYRAWREEVGRHAPCSPCTQDEPTRRRTKVVIARR